MRLRGFQRKLHCSLTIIYFRGQYTDEITIEPEQSSIFTVAYKKSLLKLFSS